MKCNIYLANIVHEKTEYLLFPKGQDVIEGWNEEMAKRLLPVAMFNPQQVDSCTQ